MAKEDAQAKKDKEQLDELEKDIEQARQHLKELTHENEESFIEETSRPNDQKK